MASIGKLFIELGVKADTGTLKQVSGVVKGLRTNLLLTAAAFTGAVAGLDRFVSGTLKGVVALQNLNVQTGLSIEKLNKFQQAGQLSNLALSADQISQSIGNVQKNLAEIRLGRGNLAPFQFLGIDPLGQDAFGVIEQLRESIKGLDPATATNIISQIGLTPDFINILKLSRKEFDALGENIFLSKEQRGDIDKLGTSFKALSLRLKALKDQSVAKLAPELDKLIQKFFKWLKDNGDKVIKTISGLAKGFATFATAVGRAFELTSKFLEKIVGLENGIAFLSAAFAVLSLSFSPFLLGLAAVILLLEDIAVFKSGGDSLIGDLVEGFKELPSFSGLFGDGDVANVMDTITKSMVVMTGAAIALAAPLVAIVGALTFLSQAPDIGKKIAAKIDETEAGQGLGNFMLDVKNTFGEFIDVNKAVLSPAAPNGGASSVITNNFTISGVQDPVAVKNEVNTLLTSPELIRAQSVQSNGVR